LVVMKFLKSATCRSMSEPLIYSTTGFSLFTFVVRTQRYYGC